MERSVKFTLFADFHYKEGMYAVTIPHMETILDRASQFGASFLLHAGDLCNDYGGSPELLERLKTNSIPYYGVYGNHELETGGTMALVTPYLTNRDVVWGTDDGTIGDGSVGYYHFDYNGYRFICLDTNYSRNQDTGAWEHNPAGSHGWSEGNTQGNSIGDVQFAWLRRVLTDGAEQGFSCILLSHVTICSAWSELRCCPDTEAIEALCREINAIRPRTVMAILSGHEHIDRAEVIDNIFRMSVSAVINCFWKMGKTDHYANRDTAYFTLMHYDETGIPVGEERIGLYDLQMGQNTHFCAEPLSANIILIGDDTIEVEGVTSHWAYHIDPDPASLPTPYTVPWISSHSVKLR